METKNKEVEKIQERIENSEEFLNELGSYIDENFIIPSYSEEKANLRKWKTLFRVEIPEEINFPILISLAAEVARKYQEASFFRDRQQLQLTILEQNRTNKFNTIYNQTRRESENKFSKPLAAESCKVAALLAVEDLDEALNNQKVIKDFWDSTCKALTEMRKTLEIIGYALGSDARLNKEFVIKGN